MCHALLCSSLCSGVMLLRCWHGYYLLNNHLSSPLLPPLICLLLSRLLSPLISSPLVSSHLLCAQHVSDMEDTLTCSHATFSQVFGHQGQLMQASE